MSAVYDHLLAILITFLTPLFLGEASGNTDLAVARAAATEAVNSFHPRNGWELFVTVQVVAFSMAAVGSVGLSLDDKLPLTAILRCRSNANALQRASDRAHDRLQRRQAQPPGKREAAPLTSEEMQDTVNQAAEAQRAVAAARAVLEGRPPSPSPPATSETGGALPPSGAEAGPVAPPAAAPPPPSPLPRSPRPEAPVSAAAQPTASRPATPVAPPAQAARPRQGLPTAHQLAWANAMAAIATEMTQEISHLPPSQQHLQPIRITALTEASRSLSRGEQPEKLPGFPFARGNGPPASRFG